MRLKGRTKEYTIDLTFRSQRELEKINIYIENVLDDRGLNSVFADLFGNGRRCLEVFDLLLPDVPLEELEEEFTPQNIWAARDALIDDIINFSCPEIQYLLRGIAQELRDNGFGTLRNLQELVAKLTKEQADLLAQTTGEQFTESPDMPDSVLAN